MLFYHLQTSLELKEGVDLSLHSSLTLHARAHHQQYKTQIIVNLVFL